MLHGFVRYQKEQAKSLEGEGAGWSIPSGSVCVLEFGDTFGVRGFHTASRRLFGLCLALLDSLCKLASTTSSDFDVFDE